MEDLPIELQAMIIEELWEDAPDRGPSLVPPKKQTNDTFLLNLRSARLVSKKLCAAASTIFKHTFFQVKWISLSKQSVQELLDISATPQYARHIHTLRISVLNYDAHLFDSGPGIHLLSRALKNLKPYLTSILLSLKVPENSPDSQLGHKVLQTLTCALYTSTVQPPRLRIYTNDPTVLVLPNHAALRNAHMTNLLHLRSLKLDFLNPSTIDAPTHRSLTDGTIARFLGTLRSLQSLSIYFATEIWYRAPLVKILGPSPLPSLTTLRLHGFSAREAEFLAFLDRHKTCLRSLELADFKLRNGRWRNVYSAMASTLELERLSLRRIWDKEEVFALSDFDFRCWEGGELAGVEWGKVARARKSEDVDVESVLVGGTGVWVGVPGELLYDEDDVGDGEGEEVGAGPWLASLLAGPGRTVEEGGEGRPSEEGGGASEGVGSEQT